MFPQSSQMETLFCVSTVDFDIEKNMIWCIWTHPMEPTTKRPKPRVSDTAHTTIYGQPSAKMTTIPSWTVLRRYDASSDSLPGGISVFESTDHSTVFEATKNLIAQLNCRYVMFSYANKAKLSERDLREIFGQYKLIDFAAFDHKENAMRHATVNSDWLGDQGKNQEFLILIEK